MRASRRVVADLRAAKVRRGPAEGRLGKKRKVALFLAYVGAGYSVRLGTELAERMRGRALNGCGLQTRECACVGCLPLAMSWRRVLLRPPLAPRPTTSPGSIVQPLGHATEVPPPYSRTSPSRGAATVRCIAVPHLARHPPDVQGMQHNPNAKTIEADLERAIVAAGGISADNAGDFRKVSWNRAARTGAGLWGVETGACIAHPGMWRSRGGKRNTDGLHLRRRPWSERHRPGRQPAHGARAAGHHRTVSACRSQSRKAGPRGWFASRLPGQ